jgi:hypothetical protein
MFSVVSDNYHEVSEADDGCLRKPKHVGLLDHKNKLLYIEWAFERSMTEIFLSLMDMERACLCINLLKPSG